MKVYEFEKCLLQRMEECLNVLSWENNSVPASAVRSEWSYYIELQIEPTGWQTLWKIPRVICEQLNIKYPTIVCGMVENVMFKELKATLLITAVQDDDVHLPEQQEVNLIDLYPTKLQENTELNVEKTANCIDALRFFYNHVWLPWDNDNDDDIDWAEKHLESRLRFYYDLKKSDMKRSMADHIKTLLVEARYIQERREFLELTLSDDDDGEEIEEDFKQKHDATDLMHLHLRLTIIKSKIDMLQNPKMRKLFQDVKSNAEFDNNEVCNKTIPNQSSSVCIVTKPFSMQEQTKYLEIASKLIKPEQLVQICSSLQNALNICNSTDKIILFPGKHCMRFMEYLNDNGSITGLYPGDRNSSTNSTTVMSATDESILLVINGDFTLRNLQLDCRNIRTGILIRNGKVIMENCQLNGNPNSSTGQGIFVMGKSSLVLKNCCIEDFATGISVHNESQVTFTKSLINSCQMGIEIKDEIIIKFDDLKIENSKYCGINIETGNLINDADKLAVDNISDLQKNLTRPLKWSGECSFKNITKGNIIIVNTKAEKFIQILDSSRSDSMENIDAMSVSSEKEVEIVAGSSSSAAGDLSISESLNSDDIVVDDSMSEYVSMNL